MKSVSAPGSAGGRGAAERWLPLLLLLGALGYLAYFWSDPVGPGRWSPLGEESLLAGDSNSYLDFGRERWASRWAGYPVFLDLVGAVFPGTEAVLRVQLVLAAFAVAFLAGSLLRTLRAPRPAALVALLLFVECSLTRYHAYLVSEAVFVPLLTLMAGVLLRCSAGFGNRPGARSPLWLLAAASALLGLAITVRPSALFLAAIAPALVWLFRSPGKRWRVMAAALLPLALCLFAENRVWNRAYPDLGSRPNIANRHLFAKALLLPSEPPASGDREADEFLADARRTLAPVREALADAPGWWLRSVLLGRAEHAAQHPTYFRLFRERAATLAAARDLPPDRFLGALARPALLAAPGEWLRNAAIHYVALWAHDALHDEAFARRHRAWARALPDSPVMREARFRGPVPPSRRLPGWALFLARAAALAAFAASLLAIAAAVRRRRRRGPGGAAPALVVAAVSALAVHGYFLLVAVFNFGKMRYASAMWPLTTLCGLLVIHWALGEWQRRRRTA